jgi:Carboxypeptidase regulatory-like domain/TonB-dependent Receptor Plug Domain
MKKIHCVVFALVLTLLCAASSWSQEQITTGTVKGDITDPKGGGVAGAAIEIKNLDTNLTRTDSTNADGHFTFLNLPPGRYTLTITKQGFATVEQQNVNLTVGQAITLPITLKVSSVSEKIVVTDVPLIETTKTESSSTLNELSVERTPVLGRKFEDLLTLTPGVSIVQGPDGDEINFNGQRGIFNNISLDGGDYNNGFFGEQLGGQRAAIDITLDAVKEFQVVASGASAEFGRTAGGVVNVITKSGTNDFHGSLFYFQRLEALSSATSDGKPLQDFHREQFGGTIGGPIKKDKMFIFGAFEQILENLTRPNLGTPLGSACPVTAPVVGVNDALINTNPECQRVALVNFIKGKLSEDESLPVKHPVRNSSAFGRFDWNLTPKNQFFTTYSFDYSKNTNQTFDVATYGTSANGIEGPSKINNVNFNLNTTVSPTKLNEAHFSYQRELRPRAAVSSKIPADTGIGFSPSFRFGNPFFLEPTVDETIWRTQVRDNFTIVQGRHTWKFGGEWLHTLNAQTFRGFFTGRYLFDSVDDFLHYASPASMGPGFGPTAPGLLFYLQDGIPTGLGNIPPGASTISNEDYALFIQDKWQVVPGFTVSYGLRWEAQIFPDAVSAPSKTAYGIYLSNPAFPSDGTLHNQKQEFQPRLGFAWDIGNKHKSVLRASAGIYNGRQNMLSQVGSITTNGVQQRTAFFASGGGATGPTWPNALPVVAGNPSCTLNPALPNPFPCFTGVRVFSKNYHNPRIYTANVAFEQDLTHNFSAYIDLTWSKGVYLTRFFDANNGAGPTVLPANGDTVTYLGASPFGPNLGSVFVTSSAGKSLYRGGVIGIRKRWSQKWQMEANYTLSEDLDDDSNERDPFTDRTFNRFNLLKDYAFSDRDERHRFNFYTTGELPAGFTGVVRMQAHTAQPITDNFTLVSSGAPCTPTNSNTRVVAGIDCGRNHLRKDNGYFTFDWRLERPFHIGDRMRLIPIVEMFNTFNNKNNINPLSSPALFDFNGFLRFGVGDPRQAQLALRFLF